jgi:hypothetical protein
LNAEDNERQGRDKASEEPKDCFGLACESIIKQDVKPHHYLEEQE